MPHRLVLLASRSAAEPFINSFSISTYIAVHSRIFQSVSGEAKESSLSYALDYCRSLARRHKYYGWQKRRNLLIK